MYGTRKMRKTCKNCGLEVEMGDAGVGGDGEDPGLDAPAPGTEGNTGMSPGTAGNIGIDASGADMGVGGGSIGPDVGPDTQGPQGGGPADIPPIEKPKAKPKPVKVEEKKEGIKRKARKRSLLGEEDTEIYRRSILGS